MATKRTKKSLDKELKGRPSFLKLLHGKLKDTVLSSIEKVIENLGDKVVDSEDDLSSEELKRQYRALQRAKEKYGRDVSPLRDRSLDAFNLAVRVYFTILSKDAHWTRLSAYFLEEYRKERQWENYNKIRSRSS